ncbi:MAG: hypothetical protein GXP08_16975 [Gammaproteobacteria bacterium]|nr:hypothetical protein [Gammaproteobacteria bacterium]
MCYCKKIFLFIVLGVMSALLMSLPVLAKDKEHHHWRSSGHSYNESNYKQQHQYKKEHKQHHKQKRHVRRHKVERYVRHDDNRRHHRYESRHHYNQHGGDNHHRKHRRTQQHYSEHHEHFSSHRHRHTRHTRQIDRHHSDGIVVLRVIQALSNESGWVDFGLNYRH